MFPTLAALAALLLAFATVPRAQNDSGIRIDPNGAPAAAAAAAPTTDRGWGIDPNGRV